MKKITIFSTAGLHASPLVSRLAGEHLRREGVTMGNSAKEADSMGPDRQLRGLFAAAMPFVAARRKATGGFGATPRLPATIEDTYHALHILELARQYDAVGGNGLDPAADGKLRSYLAACQRTLPTGARTTFQFLWCCRAAGLELDREAVSDAVAARMRASASQEEWYYRVRILADVLGMAAGISAGAPGCAAVMDRKWRSVDEAWMHLYLARACQYPLPLPSPELISWFQACQNGDGGFGFFPGTTSFVENCHAGLRALTLLGAKPLDPARASGFVTGCQTAAGGFGRSSRAAPFLDATWHALTALAIIG